MIFVRATKYVINPEKAKPFLDYLLVLTKKTRMLEMNLSFEYGMPAENEVVLLERWSSHKDYQNYISNKEFAVEIQTLSEMASKTLVLYEFTTIK
ncbi:putative quinol monooxygenase [Mycoplasmopsis glycophila]|uniref:ABM domain-containing protein n=1 Tax=Mycoplasmopsis glycophila TaxID=171285 RepID=A0A449AUK3_9BACT|nr:antibiotic biosynthesis monooxygenase [Mycoplasmopsis glycophila]VEU70168.1 Uncharacterised protein [Mycoplasmopsis glycophila]